MNSSTATPQRLVIGSHGGSRPHYFGLPSDTVVVLSASIVTFRRMCSRQMRLNQREGCMFQDLVCDCTDRHAPQLFHVAKIFVIEVNRSYVISRRTFCSVESESAKYGGFAGSRQASNCSGYGTVFPGRTMTFRDIVVSQRASRMATSILLDWQTGYFSGTV